MSECVIPQNGNSFLIRDYHIVTLNYEWLVTNFLLKVPINAVIINVDYPDEEKPKKRQRTETYSSPRIIDSFETIIQPKTCIDEIIDCLEEDDSFFSQEDFESRLKKYVVSILFKDDEILNETETALEDVQEIDFIDEYYGEGCESPSLEEVDYKKIILFITINNYNSNIALNILSINIVSSLFIPPPEKCPQTPGITTSFEFSIIFSSS